MLHLPHLNQGDNIPSKNSLRKAFTLIELIISLAIGSILILGTYNVMTQSLATINATTVAGTMDNYAASIQKKVRSELINAQYVDTGLTKLPSNKLTSANGIDYYKNLYFAGSDKLMYGLMFDSDKKTITLNFFPTLGIGTDPSSQESSEIKTIFSEEGSNGVEILDFKWNIDNYSVSAEEYNNPDFISRESRVVAYQFRLRKSFSNGKPSLEKTYYYKEVIECAI